MKYRLSKVLKDCNMSLQKAYNILTEAGMDIEFSPNFKIGEEEKNLLFIITEKEEKQRDEFLKRKKIETFKIKKEQEEKKKQQNFKEFEESGLITETILIQKQTTLGKPSIVYKYMSNKYVLKTLIENYLFFNSIEKFNDPFDSNINLFTFNKPIRKGKRYYRLKENERIFKNELRKYKVCCFTRNENNMLMWSHYANSHNGVCLGFSTKSNDINPLDIHYTKDFIKAEFYPIESDKINHIFYSKSIDWCYEEEMRMVKTGLSDGRFTFNPKDLQSIYFGVNICKTTKKRVIDIIYEKYQHIRIYQAYLSKNSYEIIYEEEFLKPKKQSQTSTKSKRLEKINKMKQNI